MTEAAEPPSKREKPESREETFQRLFNWASQLTAESSEDESYLWPASMKRLLERLKFSQGALVGVLGLRGVGKSRAMQNLGHELDKRTEDTDYVLYFKWAGGNLIDVAKDWDSFHARCDSYLAEWIEGMAKDDPRFRDKLEKLYPSLRGEKASLVWNLAARRWNKVDTDKIVSYLHVFEHLIPARVKKQHEKEAAWDILKQAKMILIDLPDYPNRDPRRISADIDQIQELWQAALEAEMNPNIVLFIQAETFATEDHFFFGKLLVYRIDPFKPEELIQRFKEEFGSFNLFDDDALDYIARLSRGIFRRFKRFLGVCLEEYLVSGDRAKPIDLELAKVALTEDEIFREMDLELSQIFKKEDARRLAAKILDLLMKAKEASQGSIAKTLQVSESAVSRILDRLEDYALVRREWRGQEKIVKANF